VIRLYRAEGGELKVVESGNIQDALWIDAVAPTPEEVESLHQRFRLDLQDVADCLDPNERSRIEIEESYDLLVLRSLLAEEPNGERETRRVQTMPIGIFVTRDKVVTVRLVSSFSYLELTSDLKRKPKIDTKEDVLLQLMRKVNRDIERRVRPMERTISAIQQDIVTSKRSEVAPTAFVLSNNLIVLNMGLLANLNAMSMLPKAKHFKLNKEQLDIVEDLEDDVAQLYEMTTIYREVMANLLSAYESGLANNLQKVMKTLTTISIILFIPIMMTALFSMNVHLPLSKDDPVSFWVVILMSAVLVLGMWFIFRIKRIL
jgi:magnesium transporter